MILTFFCTLNSIKIFCRYIVFNVPVHASATLSFVNHWFELSSILSQVGHWTAIFFINLGCSWSLNLIRHNYLSPNKNQMITGNSISKNYTIWFFWRNYFLSSEKTKCEWSFGAGWVKKKIGSGCEPSSLWRRVSCSIEHSGLNELKGWRARIWCKFPLDLCLFSILPCETH